MISRRVRAVGATLLVAVLVAGCGADEKSADDKSGERSGSQVDVDDEKVTVEDDEGNVTSYGEGVEVPDDFPEEIPLPQGDYKVNSVLTQGEETTMMLAFEAADMKGLEDHIKSGLAEAGYVIEDGMRIDQESGKQVHFSATSTDHEVQLLLMVTPRQEASAVYTVKKAAG